MTSVPTALDQLVNSPLGDVPLTLSVRIGRVRRSLQELSQLEEGSLLVLDSKVDTPLELVVDGRVIAKGQLVEEEDGNLGIKIIEVIGSAS